MIAVACSLQLSHELGICNNHKHTTSKLKRLDALSFHLLNRVYQPIWSSPSRLNVFICRSSVIPIRVNEIPILKTAATAVARAYNGFPGNSFVLRLVPGLVIIVFAIWGLVPLVSYGRNLFLKRSDNSWKRSGAHYVTTSYLQPLLLWTGATLVCRAFDPVVLSSEASQSVKQRLLVFVKSLSTVLAFACCLSSLIQQAQQFLLEANDSNDARDMGFQFAGKAVYSAVWVAAVSLFMELLGFSTQKLITAGGLGTVLLTLAGREIFTNFLSSMMIHATRPFVLNDWIQTKIEGYEVSGTVEHVGWWSPTIIRGDDREAVHIPNHKFTVNVVRNLSQKTHWRINTHFSISHLDVNKIHLIVADMRKVLAKSQQVEQQRLHRRVFLERINPENQALVIMVSCFVKTSRIEEYFCVKEAILLDLLRVISHHRARLATPIRTVQKMQSDEDTENIPFSDTIFTRARPDTNRPFLLIEPPYRINGDDKTKAHPRSARTNEEQVAKVNSNLLDYSKSSKAKEVPPDGKVDMQVEETGFDTETDCEIVTMSQSKFADTMVATTSTPLNSKNGSNSAALLNLNQGMSESVVANKVAATSIDPQKADSKVVATSDSEMDPGVATTSTDCGPASHISISSSDEQQSSGMDNVSVAKISSCQPGVPQLKGLDLRRTSSKDTSVLGVALEKHPVTSFDSGMDEVQYVPTVTSHFKQETETMPIPPSPQARSNLEDNIILGVALEGSKRTLLIEEVVTLSPHSEEIKELAACGNANGSSSAPSDILPVPTDQRDK